MGTMKALVYAGVGKPILEERPIPELLKPTDAIVKMVQASICGTDLHILKGDVATCSTGRILGHEGIGVVHSVGDAVKSIKPNDKVIISAITACTTCEYCKKGMSSHCVEGGWILGNTIDGTQAEYVRVPHADGSLHLTPSTGKVEVSEEEMVTVSDVLPTGFECGVLNGRVTPGCTLAVVGAGPVGLGALITAQLYSPSTVIVIDLDTNRLENAKRYGATHTVVSGPNAVAEVMALTDNKGVDTVIEAVGLPKSFDLCQDIVAVGGTIANLGVHGCKVDLHLDRLWSHNITITTRMLDATTTPMIIKLINSGQLNVKGIITHKFSFDEMEKAYETFGKAAEFNALKTMISF